MTTENNTEISVKLTELQQRYYAQLPERINEIESLWQNYNIKSPAESLLNDLHCHAHKLMESAGTFGAAQLSRVAKELDHFLKSILEQHKTLSEEEREVINRIIYHIKEQAEISIHSTHKNNQPLKWHDLEILKFKENNLIYVVDDDKLTTQRIALELYSHNFEVKTFSGIDDFLEACEKKIPDVIIMGIVFSDKSDDGVQAIKRLKDIHSVIPPVIFISMQSNIDIRLAAMRVGAARFVEKPLKYEKLRAMVEGLSTRNLAEPYRVLIVDDSAVMAEYYATILNQVGIDTCIITDPMTVLDVLAEFNPDLILMDLYMPGCSGIELASVIRQNDDYIHTSIVFLSSEKEAGMQFNAVEVGADEFITKLDEPEQLIATVLARVKRTRWLNRIYSDLQSALRDNQFQQVALDSHSIVSMTDASGDIIYVNDRFVEISGYSRKELIGKNHRLIKSGEHSNVFYQDIWQTISKGNIWTGEIKNRSKNGDYYWVESTIVPFLDDSGLPYKYVSIRTDITPIMQIQEDLFDAKERAESANRAKTDFLSNMSHELRTPMNAILGFSQLLLMDGLSQAQKDSLEEIVKAGNHLLELINDVLDLARIESDRLSISIEPVSLCELVVDCQNLIAPLVEEKNIQFDIQKPENADVIVSADRIRLKQIILNLLSNAIKYNDQGGSVKLYCQQQDDKLRLFIEDTGIGIAEDDISELFIPFHRLVDHTYGAEGTGIGLVITRRLVELMGGEIGLESEEGKGSTFWIDLNLDKYVEASEVYEADTKKAISSDKADIHTVLYVEDNPVNMLLVEKLINKTDGFEIIKAFTPEEGIKLAAKHKIDLFLLDINLPGMNGYELLQYFRNQQDTKNIKAIALSANAMLSDVTKGKESGFDDYITKPIVIDEFIDKLKSVFE